MAEAMSPDRRSVGERIRSRRRELGLPQRALTGDRVSASYVSYVEAGKRTPSVRALRHIAERLGVTPEYLETGRDPVSDSALLEDAELELRLGEIDRAVEQLDAARDRALEAGDTATAARATESLIVARASAGDADGAAALFEGIPRKDRPPVASRPDVYTAVARARADAGDLVGATALLRACLEEVKGADVVDDLLFVRYSTQLSYALTDCGDIAGATAVLVEALERGENVADPYAELRLRWSLGRLHATGGRPELASRYFRQAIALCERTEDRFHLAAAHESLASTLLDQRDPDGALPHIEAAEAMYGEVGDAARVGMVAVERARHALLTNDLDTARDLALGSLDLLDSGKAPPDASGDAWRTLGELYMELGDYGLAEQCMRRAIETLASAPAKYQADARRSLARLLEATGREREALRAMWEASDLVTSGRPVDLAPDSTSLT